MPIVVATQARRMYTAPMGRNLGSLMPPDVAAASHALITRRASIQQLAASVAIVRAWQAAQPSIKRRGFGLGRLGYTSCGSGGCYVDGVWTPNLSDPIYSAPAPVDFSNPVAVIQALQTDNPYAIAAQQAYDKQVAGSTMPILVTAGGGDPFATYENMLLNPGGAASINSNLLVGSGIATQTAITLPTPIYPAAVSATTTVTGGGGSTAVGTASVPSGGTSTGTQAPATGGGTSTATGNTQSAQPTQAQLSNVSNPSAVFQSGDAWSLVISGSPNAAVTVTATQNGKNLGATALGKTDASGRLVLTGSMSDANIGAWVEIFTVGSGAPATINFNVVAKGAGSSSTGPTGGGGSTATGNSNPITSAASNPASFPTWALIGAAVVGGLLLMRGGR